MKPQLLFIDHPVHLATASTDFLFDMLQDYQIEKDYTHRFRHLLRVKHYDVVLYFQGLPDLKDIPLLKSVGTILVPMYDQVRNISKSIWFEFRDFRILSFSHTLHQKLVSYGLESRSIQFFPEMEPVREEVRTDSCVFWVRDPLPNLETFQTVMKNQKIGTLHLRDGRPAGDEEGTPGVSPNIRRFGFTKDRSHYTDLLDQASYYFAARNFEGIGLSFLEAMARGVCVVAPDRPTMNEYIVSGVTGILYDPNHPVAIDPVDVATIRNNLAFWGRTKRKEYLAAVPGILEFLREAPATQPWYSWVPRGFALSWLVSLLRRMKWMLEEAGRGPNPLEVPISAYRAVADHPLLTPNEPAHAGAAR